MAPARNGLWSMMSSRLAPVVGLELEAPLSGHRAGNDALARFLDHSGPAGVAPADQLQVAQSPRSWRLTGLPPGVQADFKHLTRAGATSERRLNGMLA